MMVTIGPSRSFLLSLIFMLLVSGFAKLVKCEKNEGGSPVGLHSSDGPKQKLNVLVVTFHVNGHLMPLISLGKELQSRGHNVTIAANRIEGDRNPEKVVRESGLSFFEAGHLHMTKAELEKMLEELAENPVNLLAAFRMFARMEVELFQELDPHFGAGGALGSTDILIADGMTQTGVWLAHKFNLPVIINDPHSFAGEQACLKNQLQPHTMHHLSDVKLLVSVSFQTLFIYEILHSETLDVWHAS